MELIPSNVNGPEDLHKLLLAVVSLSKKSFITIGRILYELKRDDNFKMATGVETWNDYLRQPEIGFSPGEASRLIQIYEHFVMRFGFDEETIADISVKNMHYLLPIAKKTEDRDHIEGLVADATFLNQKDFKSRLFDFKMGEDAERTYEYMIMRKTLETNTMDKVHDVDSDTIKRTFNLS